MDLKLSNIGLGALDEAFQEEFKKTVLNILDPNTVAATAREINIKIKIKPSPENRELCDFGATITSKMAPPRTHFSKLSVGLNQQTGEVNAAEIVAQPGLLFPQDGSKVTKMEVCEK